ncbi:tetratricopeptide repeat protein [Cyclobacteriaceae bacterium]|nr:tetratricopeptide repeat protein [Cyclobacteriaceae bacterium]
MKLFLLISTLLLSSLLAQSQELIKDSVNLKLVQKSLNHLNNFEFDEFDVAIDSFKLKYEHHPSYPLAQSMKIYYLSSIDLSIKEEDTTYLNLLTQVIGYSEKLLEKDENSIEGLFFALCGYGFRAQYYSDYGYFTKSIGEGRKAYKYYKKGKDFRDQLSEFYFMTGLYNYYIVQYPENHSIVKPFMAFFENGDKALGLKELQFTTKNADFTKASAYIYMIDLYIKYEGDYEKSIKYGKEFLALFPKNPLAQIGLGKSYLLNKDYKGAQQIANLLKQSKSEFCQLHAEFFELWIKTAHQKPSEKYIEELQVILEKVIKNPKISFDIIALIYYKQAQQYDFLGEDQLAKKAYKESLDTTIFVEITETYKAFQKK